MASPKLTQKNGKRLAGGKPIRKTNFALPGAGPGGKDAYPIDTPGRARNALSRGAENATPSQQATIKRKVKAKYPGIAVGGKPAGGSKPARPRSSARKRG